MFIDRFHFFYELSEENCISFCNWHEHRLCSSLGQLVPHSSKAVESLCQSKNPEMHRDISLPHSSRLENRERGPQQISFQAPILDKHRYPSPNLQRERPSDAAETGTNLGYFIIPLKRISNVSKGCYISELK